MSVAIFDRVAVGLRLDGLASLVLHEILEFLADVILLKVLRRVAVDRQPHFPTHQAPNLIVLVHYSKFDGIINNAFKLESFFYFKLADGRRLFVDAVSNARDLALVIRVVNGAWTARLAVQAR
jgi:hypothetical protein